MVFVTVEVEFVVDNVVGDVLFVGYAVGEMVALLAVEFAGFVLVYNYLDSFSSSRCDK